MDLAIAAHYTIFNSLSTSLIQLSLISIFRR